MAGLAYAMPMIMTFTSNVQRSLEFYRDILGFHENMVMGEFAVLSIPGGMSMALHGGGQSREPEKMTNTLPVFSVEDVAAAKKALDEKGVNVLGDAHPIPGGLVLDVADPDGNVVQLMQRTI
jgi:predicted enzyme related to lactoylglutathione lyase